MRVIAGRHGGRKLIAPDSAGTRPVTDRVKESVFSSLGEAVVGARVADLYAGSGSFGIEALSRGAASAVFVENGRKALAALRSNLSNLGLEDPVVPVAVERFVAESEATFDLVFSDPPWSLPADRLRSLLEDLRDRLDPDAIVVVTRRAGEDLADPAGYRIDDDRRLGDTRIIRYRRLETP